MRRKFFIVLLTIISTICLALGLTACGDSVGGSGGSETETISATSVSLDNSSLNLTVDDVYSLTATISPSNATNKNVTWSSSNTFVATVSSGKITAVSAGSATITVKTEDGGYTATCSVKVTEAESQTVSVTSVSLNYSTLFLEVGKSSTLSATVLPSNATNKKVSWSSSDSTVATVSGGKIKAVSAGTAVIIVTTSDGGKVATCTVTVTEPVVETIAVTSVSLNTNSLSLTVGGSSTLIATVLPSNATNQNVIWESSDSSVAIVTNGIVTAIAAGTATITVTTEDGNYTNECIITVNDETPETVAITSVNLDITNISLDIGDTYTLTATVSPQNATNQNVTWSSSDNTVATVSGGVVAAISAGTVIITITTEDGGYTAECVVTITEPTISVTSVSLNYSSLSLVVGNNSTLTATVLPSNATNQNVTWSSSNISVATVTNGVVTALAEGTATISVTTADGGYTAICSVTVKSATISVTSVSLNHSSLSLVVGGNSTLTATVLPSNATNQNVTWSSSNTSVATVSNGVITAVSAGSTTVTVKTSDGGYTAKCIVTVEAATAAVLSVDNATVNGNEIYLLAEHTTTSISLSGAVTCSDNSSWKLYSNDTITEIPTKVMASLADGTNTYYIVVTSTSDSTVSNTYILNVYRSFAVTVNYYNGSNKLYSETAYTGYTYSADYVPDITGYTFNYWKTGGQAYSATIILADLNLYADTTVNNYTVTYDANNGNLNETQKTVTYNSGYTLAVPERTGYTFNGWYYGSTQITNENGNSLSVWKYTENITVTANWTVNNYTVTLTRSDSSAGTVSGGGSYAYGSIVTITATTNIGYTWVGWYNGDTLLTNELSYTFIMGLDSTYTAKWTYYTVTTLVNDENAGSVTTYSDNKVTVGEEVTITATTESGYTFVGWFNDETHLSSALSYTFTMPAKNITYTAKWLDTTVAISSNISSGGSVSGLTTTNNILGNTLIITADVNLGYTWLGWYKNNELYTTDYSFTYIISEEIASFNATYKINDEMSNFDFTSTTTTCTVTGIIDNTVTEIIIPDYVTKISNSAFSGCLNLFSLILGVNVSSIDSSAFYECNKLVEVYNLSSLKITAGYSGNGYVAYYAKNVYTPTSGESHLEKQDNFIFISDYGNYYLVAYVGTETNITLPTSINGKNYSIYQYAFYGCTTLESISILSGVTSIGKYSFAYFSSLKSIEIGSSVTSISDYAFYNCSSLTSMTIDNGLTSIGKYTFANCTSLDSVKIPDSVTSIGTSAFRNCTSLTSVTISNNLTFIDEGTFMYCTSLKTIIIPDSVTSIGNSAFKECTALTELTIGSGVNKINNSAFDSCTSLIAINYNATSVDSLYSTNYVFTYAGQNSSGITVTIGANVTVIPAYLFSPRLGSAYVPKIRTLVFESECKCTGIGYSAFRYCPLTSLTLPDSITSIGGYAFRGCSSLTSVTIGSNVTSIGTYAFAYCSKLKSITFANTSGWFLTATEGATSGTSIDVTDTSANVTYFTETYYEYYWYRSES